MFNIRAMHREDIPFAVKLSDQEKWGITRADFERLLTLAPRGCFVAYSGHKRLGLVTTTSYGREAAWIGNVVVEKSSRGKHIGAGLVRHSVGYLKKSGVKRTILYCFHENVKFYENLGFVKDAGFVRLRRKRRTSSRGITRNRNLHVPPINRILSADRKAFGGDRGKLIRLMVRNRIGWYVGAERGAASTCYLFVKQYEDMCEFGPWVCINPQRGASRHLFETALSIVSRQPVEIACLLSHPKELALLRRHGFRITNTGCRMFYGKRQRLGDDRAQYALGFLDKG